MGAVGVEIERARGGLPQARGQLGVDPAGPAQLGEQQLVRPVQPAAQAAVIRPRLGGRHEQAGVLGGLQQELQPPAWRTRRTPHELAGIRPR